MISDHIAKLDEDGEYELEMVKYKTLLNIDDWKMVFFILCYLWESKNQKQ